MLRGSRCPHTFIDQGSYMDAPRLPSAFRSNQVEIAAIHSASVNGAFGRWP
jgi:hypothetical protein